MKIDNRIERIARTLCTSATPSMLGVGDINSPSCHINVGQIKADTIFTICRVGRKDVSFFVDSKEGNALRFILVYEGCDIGENEYAGVRFSRIQKIALNDFFNTEMTVLYFDDTPETTEDSFDEPGHPSDYLNEAVLRSSIYILHYLSIKNPGKDFWLNMSRLDSGEISFNSSINYWSGNAYVCGYRAYHIGISCEELHFVGGRPSQDDIYEIVTAGFGHFSYVEDVQALSSIGYFGLEFSAFLQ